MTKFTINPRVVYSGDTCYITIAAFIVISQSIYLLTHLGARTSTMSCLNYCETWGIETRRTSVYHPETNGKVEPFIKSYNRNQLKKVTDDPDWRDVRPCIARRRRVQAFAQPTGSDVTIQQTQAPLPDPQPSTSYATPRNDNRNTETEPMMVIDPPHGYHLRRRRAQPGNKTDGHKRQRCAAFY